MADSKRRLGVVFASAEAAPFVKTGGLGDVAGSLPAALARAGVQVIVMVPNYGSIADEYRRAMTFETSFAVPLGWRSEYCGLMRLERDGVTYLFLDNERYFDRGYPYGFFDDGERFAFFSKAVCESLQHLPDGFTCDILHCNDWHTALAPVFLREFYRGIPLYDNVRTVFSIHNIAFQGQFSDEVLEDVLGLGHIPAAANQLRSDATSVNYMMGALNYADAITTVSPTYAEEIKTPAFGEGLDGVLRRRAEALQGIANGIDTVQFDPEADPAIAARFSARDLSGKAVCKARLQEELGLEVRDDRPLMVMVTRLTRQKGLDLVTYALDRILSGGVQVAVLGTGDSVYENALRYFESSYPGQMAARIQFDPALSQRMYAGADLFLMPSLFEPCGLSQIIAMRYGTLPVVRETGGLKDTVVPYNYETGEGTGFSFANFNGEELGDAVFRAARLFWDAPDAFGRVIRQAMAQDFSWTKSAARYLDLYFWLHPEIRRDAGAMDGAPAGELAKDSDDAARVAEKSAGTPSKADTPAPKRRAAATRASTPAAADAPAKAPRTVRTARAKQAGTAARKPARSADTQAHGSAKAGTGGTAAAAAAKATNARAKTASEPRKGADPTPTGKPADTPAPRARKASTKAEATPATDGTSPSSAKATGAATRKAAPAAKKSSTKPAGKPAATSSGATTGKDHARTTKRTPAATRKKPSPQNATTADPEPAASGADGKASSKAKPKTVRKPSAKRSRTQE